MNGPTRRWHLAARAAAALLAGALCGCDSKAPPSASSAPSEPPAPADAPKTAEPAEPAKPLTPLTVPPGDVFELFDGETLGNWEEAKKDDFETHGEMSIKDGMIVLGQGYPYTGIRWAGEFPRDNFEVSLEAKRIRGSDIFCGLTVPVGKEHVTLVLGGWGDWVVGLSCVDDLNASENDSTVGMSFKNDQWYEVSLRVTPPRIEAWIDGKRVINQERENHKFTIYGTLYPITPLGVFTWETDGALRFIEMKRLPEGS